MPDTRRLAVVGGGPRAFFALDCLAGVAAAHNETELAVTIYEPSAWPGAGPVYALNQPDYLLMNFTAGLIDAWDRSYAHNEHRPRLLDWLDQHYPAEADPYAYLARARVGEYLHDCFRVLAADLAPNMSLQVERDFVSSVERVGERWRVESASHSVFFDDVLLATGHQRWQREGVPFTTYPVARLQTLAAPANRALTCKGFGLTFIDTALALSLGRGGRFTQGTGGVLIYRPSGKEPHAVQPVSRTGRPMLPKPDAGIVEMTPRRVKIVAALATALGEITPPLDDFKRSIWPLFCSGADAFIDAEPGTAAHWFNTWSTHTMTGDEAAQTLRQAWAVATGRSQPDIAVALALVWRGAYPALVRLISHGGLSPQAVADYRSIAVEMERVAFGPAACNVARLLALIDAGIVDLSLLGSAAGKAHAGMTPVDIDATLPAPSLFDTDGPLPQLIENECLRLNAFGTLEIDAAARPYTAGQHEPLHSLAVVGRATELSVLGNDTLSRTLHTTLARWAEDAWNKAAAPSSRPTSLADSIASP